MAQIDVVHPLAVKLGRGPYTGPHLQVPHPAAQGPQFIPRAPASPSQMMPQQLQHSGGPVAIYHPSQFGYWYQPDFQYQQALANPQVLQNYYAQLYGLTSPTALAPYHHQYLGYVTNPPPTPPRPVILPILPPPPVAAAQQVVVQPLVQHPPSAHQVMVQPLLQQLPPQIQATPFFPVAPLLSHSFTLQLLLPPQAMAVLPPNTTETLPANQAVASAARATTTSSTPGA